MKIATTLSKGKTTHTARFCVLLLAPQWLTFNILDIVFIFMCLIFLLQRTKAKKVNRSTCFVGKETEGLSFQGQSNPLASGMPKCRLAKVKRAQDRVPIWSCGGVGV